MAQNSAQELRVGDIMSTELVTLTKGRSITFAEELMKLRHVRHLPVVDKEGRLVGLVTHRDLLNAKVSALAPLTEDERSDLQLAVPVSSVMHTELWTVGSDTPAIVAARLLQDHRFGCLPVVDDGCLAGIVTESDFLRLVTSSLELANGGPPTVASAARACPVTVTPDTTLTMAAELMRTHHVDHLPVLEDGRPVGILSEHDLHLSQSIVDAEPELVDLVVKQLGIRPPFVVSPRVPLEPVMLDMAAQGLNSALVAEDGHLEGVLTAGDACQVLAERVWVQRGRL